MYSIGQWPAISYSQINLSNGSKHKPGTALLASDGPTRKSIDRHVIVDVSNSIEAQ